MVINIQMIASAINMLQSNGNINTYSITKCYKQGVWTKVLHLLEVWGYAVSLKRLSGF